MTIAAITGLVLLAVVYAGHILFFTFGWFRLKAISAKHLSGIVKDPSSPGKKILTILLPVRNEKEQISKAIFSLSKQDFSMMDAEVIIIDDGSVDDTVGQAEALIREMGDLRFRLIRLTGEGSKKKAIEAGIMAARGELILVTDADCVHHPAWAGTMMMEFDRDDRMMVAGPVILERSHGFFTAFQELEFLGLVASGAGAAGAGHAIFCNGANLAYRREAFLEVGGYAGNERYRSGDDVFLLHRMKNRYGRKSVRFTLDPEAVVKTLPVAGPWDFLAQRARWASKSRAYRDGLAISTALSVLGFNTLLVFFSLGMVTGFMGGREGLLLVAAWILKVVVDLPLLTGITRLAGRQRLLRAYPLFQLAYPFYIVAAALASLWGGISWKGRRLSSRP